MAARGWKRPGGGIFLLFSTGCSLLVPPPLASGSKGPCFRVRVLVSWPRCPHPASRCGDGSRQTHFSVL